MDSVDSEPQPHDNDEHDKMKTSCVTQHRPKHNMNSNKINRDDNTATPELSRIQQVGNVEWLEGIMGKVSTWEIQTTHDKVKPSGFEEVEDAMQAKLMKVAAKLISGIDVT